MKHRFLVLSAICCCLAAGTTTACSDIERLVQSASNSSGVLTLAPDSELNLGLELAGNITSHALAGLAQGTPAAPILGYDIPSGRKMKKIDAPDPSSAQTLGMQNIETNQLAAKRAVLVYSGFSTAASGRQRIALIARLRLYEDKNRLVQIALPYRPQSTGFKLYSPEVLDASGVSEEEKPGLIEAFKRGIASFKDGARVFEQHLSSDPY